MFCPGCGSEVYKDAKYCKKCGLRLVPEDGPPKPLEAFHIAGEESKDTAKIVCHREKPVLSLPNILAFVYMILAVFVFFRLRPRSVNFYSTLVQCVGYSLPVLVPVFVYNMLRGRAEVVRAVSFVVTAAFILITLLGEIGRFGASGGRLEKFTLLEDGLMSLSSQATSMPRHTDKLTAPPVKEYEFTVGVGKTFPLAFPQPAKKVFLANPALADIVMVSPTEARVIGIAEGETELTIWNEAGEEKLFHIKID